MAPFLPNPDFKDVPSSALKQPNSPESVVISGMSGTFPMSSNIEDFAKILYNKVNPVTKEHSRWSQKHPEASDYVGIVPDINSFDSEFFMVHKRLAKAMDPMARKVLEHSFQAIYDAGLSPQHLKNIKVGVYIATDFSETEIRGMLDKSRITGYNLTGSSKSMFANRVSYWLNAKGPSLSINDACCGSTVALEEAFKAINSGIIEAAIVAGTNVCLAHHSLIHYQRCFKISTDGTTKSFDENANGCAKSDAISVIFLQKAKFALRAYAELVHVKNQFVPGNTCETGQRFGFVRNPDTTAEFYEKFYAETQVLPQEIEYIEASGFATPDADKAELQAIEKVFCKNRSDPLLVGSVISNIGFTDAATGATAITKVLLAYNRGLIASNLNCETPRKDIAALQDGKMRIVTENVPFQGTYAAVNCISYNGVNSHVLLRGCSKPKDLARYATTIPRLVTVSARQKQYLKLIFENLKTALVDPEKIALLQNIHSKNISGHLGRGYVVLDTNDEGKTVCLAESMEHSDDTNRPLWFVYSGMGSQWAGMGAQLMRIPIFAAAIERCHKALKPFGIDIVYIITSPDKTIFNNVLNSFVGIAAIQIGITDILNTLGLRPEKIIGHSVGELGCAYADGCLTAEEMILSAYSRGKASNDTELIRGAMAAVGLGYQQLSKYCPTSIDIACHNSASSCTISGPEESVRGFVATLTSNGIFAKEVPCANIAYHSRYIADAGPLLLRLLSDIIKDPKPRSNRWLSTSVPSDKWDEQTSKFCSPEYLSNNLLNPVLFEETSSMIPSNAVLVEIAPHGLLQAILKRALPNTCTNIPLTHRGHADNVIFLLEALGKLYVEGYTLDLQAIYPKIEFPVSVTTPPLSHFVLWNHSEAWRLPGNYKTKIAASCKVKVNVHDNEYSYLAGNVVQGKILFPFAGTLVAVWDTLAMTLGYEKRQMSVRFHDVHLYSQPILHDQKQLNLIVSLHRGSGRFEVLDGGSNVATGYIVQTFEHRNLRCSDLSKEFEIVSEEIYNNFRSRGYSYRDAFQSIASIDESVENAQIVWNNNWVTFIDGLLQLNILKSTHSGVAQPFQIRKLTIDLKKHAELINENVENGKTTLLAKLDEIYDSTRCGGVVIQNLKIQNLPPFKEVIFYIKTTNSAICNVNGSTEMKLTPAKNLSLKISDFGNIETLHWEESPRRMIEGGITVQVEYAGINNSDANKASGITNYNESEPGFGMDFSGVTDYGERVMGLVRGGAASTVVSAQLELLWPVPKHWTLKEAATVPLAYAQAFYYLCVKNELKRGWKVLVHGAAGALGQAVISVALAHGCKVFATVSDGAKKKFLLKLFPELNENDIGNSRNDSFGDMVLGATNGEGCNIVISCVRGDLKNISLKCSAFSGVTIDMVQIQTKEKFEYGMFNMTKQRSYIAADFYSVIDAGNTEELMKLQMMIFEGIARGYVRPLTHVTFGPHEAPRAFRLLTASKHRGRVLLHLRDCLARVTPRIICSSNTAHMIVWDGSSIGLQLADRLIARGAKQLRILCLEPSTNLMFKLRSWKKAGVMVDITSESVSDPNMVFSYINKHCLETSVEGIYITMSKSKWNINTEQIIKNFDTAFKKLQMPLRYFAVISGEGTNKQKLRLSQATDGLPATIINLPDFESEKDNIGSSIEECDWNRSVLDVMEFALRGKHPVIYGTYKAIENPSLGKLFPVLLEHGNNDTAINNLVLMESIPVIQSFLKNMYQVNMCTNDVSLLTKKQLLQIEANATTENVFEITEGFETFISIKEHDELRATAELLPMDTLLIDVEATLGGIEKEKSHLFVIPGIEGHYARFHGLCNRLKLSALILQPGLERPHETPSELALRHSKILLEQFKLSKHFYLLGYEFGIFVALELTAILENHGLTGTVYCIGDGPDELTAFLESELSLFKTEIEKQEALVRTIFKQMTSDPISLLEDALRDCFTWQDRIDACVRTLLGRAPHTAQYIESLLKTTYGRINKWNTLITAPNALRSQFVLLRARMSESSKPCSLQRYTQRKLVIHNLTTPLAHAAADLRSPAIVNNYLDNELLAEYEKSNIGEPYVFVDST